MTMIWLTSIDSFTAFRKALGAPEALYISANVRGSRRTLTMATVIEEFGHVLVRSESGWCAQVWRDYGHLKAVPAGKARGHC